MFIDLISYELADNVSEEKLFEVGKRIINEWMKNLPGFISWEITKKENNTYVDIVRWKSKADADNAEKEMTKIPNAMEWYSCYKEGSIKSEKLTVISDF